MNGAFKISSEQRQLHATKLDAAKLAAPMPTFPAELLPPGKTGHLGLWPGLLGPGLSPGGATQAHCLQTTAPPCLQGQYRSQTPNMFGARCLMRPARHTKRLLHCQREGLGSVGSAYAHHVIVAVKVELLTGPVIFRLAQKMHRRVTEMTASVIGRSWSLAALSHSTC
jgi:hypothetical protein